MADRTVDILIVGGGIVGAALARSLAPLGYAVLLVDDKEPPSASNIPQVDARSLALSYSSMAILEQLGVWDIVTHDATPIQAIHVSEQGAFGHARLRHDKQQPMGMVVEIDRLKIALYSVLKPEELITSARLVAFDSVKNQAVIETKTGKITVTAKMVIGADGTDSSLRKLCHLDCTVKDYQQQALVANITLARPHENWAYERFTPNGPIALLPRKGLCAALVWVQAPAETARVHALPNQAFLSELQHTFGYRLGRFANVGQRVVYPLRQVMMPQYVKGSVVFLGNAAHTIHPVAGQGFNLGLRDVAMLAQCIAQHGVCEAALAHYQSTRRIDLNIISEFTDGLIRLYRQNTPIIKLARRLGMVVFDNSPILKKIISRYASGLGGIVPDLVCGIPLQNSAKTTPTT